MSTANLFSKFALGMTRAFLFLLLSFLSVSNTWSEEWTLPLDPPNWARNFEGFAVYSQEDATLDGRKTTRVLHKADTDWALRLPERLDVQYGDVFELSYLVRNVGKRPCASGVILYDADGKALDWSFGGAEAAPKEEWQTLTTRFAVPFGVVQIELRIIGWGETNVSVAEYKVVRYKRLQIEPPKELPVVENDFLQVAFDEIKASFSITDKRTGRVWSQNANSFLQFALAAEALPDGARFRLLDAQTLTEFEATVQIEKNAPEVIVRVSADKETPWSKAIPYPSPFATRTTDRIILPINEGISFPTTEEAPGTSYTHTFGGHGLCMAFWGIVRDVLDSSQSDGLMQIVETPDDAEAYIYPRDVDPMEADASEAKTQTLSIALGWRDSMKKFGYDRVVRIIVFDKGGYVAQCKRYQEYAKEIGLYLPFEEKIARNPNLKEGIDLLVGAANIWAWNGDRMETIAKLKSLGMDRILWSAGGSAEELDKMNEMGGVLTSRYDIYQDVMNPEKFPELSEFSTEWLGEAWPQDIAWDSSDGHWTRGWEIDPKDKSQPRIPCGVLCDAKAVPYAEKRISQELAEKKYRCRFIDTTVASPWRECWNPDHLMTRSESKRRRMELLGLIGSRFNLVCGSETGIDASVPYCDYYEGMMSLGPYRCPESGRYIDKIWYEVPEETRKYQVGEAYRLPLFELVYHGCVVSYWYWGDHNDKFPELWRKRDLFNALYGVPPMYGFTSDFLEEKKERFAESYKIAEPVSRLTGYVPMTNHQILTSDRTVQKTSFANGIEVIVNFGTEEYCCVNGETVAPQSFLIVKNEMKSAE